MKQIPWLSSKTVKTVLWHNCLVFKTAMTALVFSPLKAIHVTILFLSAAQSLSDPEPDASSSDVGGVLSVGSSTSSSSGSFLTFTEDDFFFLSAGSSSELTYSFLTLTSESVSFFTSSSFCKNNQNSLWTHATSHCQLILRLTRSQNIIRSTDCMNKQMLRIQMQDKYLYNFFHICF